MCDSSLVQDAEFAAAGGVCRQRHGIYQLFPACAESEESEPDRWPEERVGRSKGDRDGGEGASVRRTEWSMLLAHAPRHAVLSIVLAGGKHTYSCTEASNRRAAWAAARLAPALISANSLKFSRQRRV